jgi:hypothetical protein
MLTFQQLPSYTTERYYLLSEIEQKSTFVFLDDDDVEVSTCRFGIMYLLCNADDDISVIKSKLREIVRCAQLHLVDMEHSLVAVEVLSNATVINEENAAKLHTIAKWILESHKIRCICFGLCNHASGTPALEKAYEYASKIHAATEPAPYIKFIATQRSDFLGHDALRQPDGQSGVWQTLYLDHMQYDALVTSGTTFAKKVAIRLDKQQNAAWNQENASSMTTEERFNKYLTMAGAVFFVLFVVVAIATSRSFRALSKRLLQFASNLPSVQRFAYYLKSDVTNSSEF